MAAAHLFYVTVLSLCSLFLFLVKVHMYIEAQPVLVSLLVIAYYLLLGTCERLNSLIYRQLIYSQQISEEIVVYNPIIVIIQSLNITNSNYVPKESNAIYTHTYRYKQAFKLSYAVYSSYM